MIPFKGTMRLGDDSGRMVEVGEATMTVQSPAPTLPARSKSVVFGLPIEAIPVALSAIRKRERKAARRLRDAGRGLDHAAVVAGRSAARVREAEAGIAALLADGRPLDAGQRPSWLRVGSRVRVVNHGTTISAEAACGVVVEVSEPKGGAIVEHDAHPSLGKQRRYAWLFRELAPEAP